MPYTPWTTIDNGREGLWALDKWLVVIRAAVSFPGDSFKNEDSSFNKQLASESPEGTNPRGTWGKIDNGAFRTTFRDYSKPWTMTKTVDFRADGTVKATRLGQDIAEMKCGPDIAFKNLVMSYEEAGERPFSILSEAFSASSSPLTETQLQAVMVGFRPGKEDVSTVIGSATAQIYADHSTEQRRLKLMIGLLELAGAIKAAVKDKGPWFPWDRDLLKKVAAAGNPPPMPVAGSASPVGDFVRDAATAGLKVEEGFALRIFAALTAKRFLVLTGLSGSGKSKVAVALARWMDAQEQNHAVVPVGADWTSNENILGYPDGLNTGTYVSKPALDLILRAADPKNANKPFFLILDEMNLSHVERYFADFLSLIELDDQPLTLHNGGVMKSGTVDIPASLVLPKNVFVIGTVNVDETTYVFSPKVLDRANVIEFRVDEPALAGYMAGGTRVDLALMAGKGAAFAQAFSAASQAEQTIQGPARAHFEGEMARMFRIFQEHDLEFGFRTAHIANRYLSAFQQLGLLDPASDTWFDASFDSLVVQKLLPKMNGSRSRLEGLLWGLIWSCGIQPGADFDAGLASALQGEDEKFGPDAVAERITKDQGGKARWGLSYGKLIRMYKRLLRDQFVSFAEA